MSNSESGESPSGSSAGAVAVKGSQPLSTADLAEAVPGRTRGGEADAAATLGAMCYGGERVLNTVRVGDGTLAVTTHRLLTLAPPDDEAIGADGTARFRSVHLPNVRDVGIGATGRSAHAYRAARYGIYALVLLLAGTMVNLEGAIQPINAPTGTGLGTIVGFASLASGMLGALDDALVVFGLVALAAALAFAASYARGRRRFVEVEVAGAAPVRLTADGVDDPAQRCANVESLLARAREQQSACRDRPVGGANGTDGGQRE